MGPILELEDFPNLLHEGPEGQLRPGGADGAAPASAARLDGDLSLANMEQAFLTRALELSGGVKLRAADLLGISRESLRSGWRSTGWSRMPI